MGENLEEYIRSELAKYSLPENTNKIFIDNLMESARLHPSYLWSLYAPNKKLKHQFDLIHERTHALQWRTAFEDSSCHIEAVAKMCYVRCSKEKAIGTMDPEKLEIWLKTFKDVPSFEPAIHREIEFWDNWHSQ